MKTVGVVLSGCGVFDGAEINETVLTSYFLDKAGANVLFYAPDTQQIEVVNHIKQTPKENETRNVLEEAGRIARGNIKPLSEIDIDEIDAVIFPGGFGVVKNLCSFLAEGLKCDIDSQAKALVQSAVAKNKAIGAMCIAPVLVARALQDCDINVELTIGNDQDVQGALKALGAKPIEAKVEDIVIDKAHKIVSTPAYMLATRISEAAAGIGKLVNKVLELA